MKTQNKVKIKKEKSQIFYLDGINWLIHTKAIGFYKHFFMQCMQQFMPL